MRSAALLQRHLRSARLTHYRNALRERVLRLRQNALAGLGILGVFALPFLMIVFFPANTLLNNSPPGVTLAAVFGLQVLSWGLVVLQSEALKHPAAERTLEGWGMTRSTARRLDLELLLLANAPLWLITLPWLVWHLIEVGSVIAMLDGLKLAAPLYLAVQCERMWLYYGRVPWVPLVAGNLVCVLVVLLYPIVDSPAAAMGMAVIPVVMGTLDRESTHDGTRSSRQPGARRKWLMSRWPWLGIPLLMLLQRQSRAQLWRVVAVMGFGGAVICALARLPYPYGTLLLLISVFVVIYVINGLFYFFDERNQCAASLLANWGMDARSLRRRSFRAVVWADVVLLSLLLLIAIPVSGIGLPSAILVLVSAMAYVPIVYWISVKSRDNVLAWSILAFFPACMAALMVG